MREKLIELLKYRNKADFLRKMGVSLSDYDCIEAFLADYLLANGVLVRVDKNEEEVVDTLKCFFKNDCDQCEMSFEDCKRNTMCRALNVIECQKTELEHTKQLLEAAVAGQESLQRRFLEHLLSAAEIIEEIEEIIDKHYNNHIFGNNDLEDEEHEAIMNFSNDITYDIMKLKEKYTVENEERCGK